MGKNKTGEKAFVGIEPGLKEGTRKYIHWDKNEIHITRRQMEQIVKKIIEAMLKQSSTFKCLYKKKFNGGSIYDDLKVGRPDEFDIDFLMEIPEVVNPILKEDTVPGFALLQLQNFHNLATSNPQLYQEMKAFVDDENYLLPLKMKMSYLQSVFDKAVNNFFPGGIIRCFGHQYKILKVQKHGTPFTLTIEGSDYEICIDLVPCILLNKNYWPQNRCRPNPFAGSSVYPHLEDFFLVPKKPSFDHPHRDRYWSLSFDMQERQIIFNRFYMKPAIRILKRIRDHFKHEVTSYSIKTFFLWALEEGNPKLDYGTPHLFKSNHSFIIVQMLKRYFICLENHHNPDFWNKKLNLWANLSQQEFDEYAKDIENMIADITNNPIPATILKYLS